MHRAAAFKDARRQAGAQGFSRNTPQLLRLCMLFPTSSPSLRGEGEKVFFLSEEVFFLSTSFSLLTSCPASFRPVLSLLLSFSPCPYSHSCLSFPSLPCLPCFTLLPFLSPLSLLFLSFLSPPRQRGRGAENKRERVGGERGKRE